MKKSKNFGFNLPSSDDPNDIADINKISENFQTIDDKLSPKKIEYSSDDGTTRKQNGVYAEEDGVRIFTEVFDTTLTGASIYVKKDKIILDRIIHAGDGNPVGLHGVATPDGTDLNQAVNVAYLKGRSGEVDPVFANNSWELIKWVCQHDDPAKYWKVGDYKFIDYPKVTRPGYISDSTSSKELFFQSRNGTRPSVNSLGTVTLKYPHKLANLIENAAITEGNKNNGVYRIYTYFWKEDIVKPCLCFFSADSTYPTDIIHEASTFEQLLEDMGAVITKTADGETYLTEENLANYGVHINEGFHYANGKVYPAKQYPIMILGFNHDNISNPYEYGKSKAGMTLCLGITRAVTENSPPHNWDTAVLPNLYESGTSQFDAANGDNTLMSPYWLGDGTNWEDTQFRTELQNLLDGTELEDKIVPVEKTTATGMWQEGNNYFPKVFTDDKISLLSEYEIIGTSKFSNAQEGDQYEFFKRGNSRFYWNTALVNNEVQRLYLWLRSPINPKSFSSGVDKPLDYKGGCNLQCNSINKAKTSDSSVATVVDVNKLVAVTSSRLIPSGNSVYDYSYSVRIEDGTIAIWNSQIEGYRDEIATPSLEEAKLCLLIDYGIEVHSNESYINFDFTISRNEQVGYTQGANSGNTKGSLLPIFCL